MASLDFYLYRTKFFPSRKPSLFHEKLTKPEIFACILKERPSLALRKRYFWHVGNVKYFDDRGGYFAAGRTTKSIVAKYDEDTKNFIEEPQESSPYTHVFFDIGIGFIAIARKTTLSPTVSGIARNLARLFEQSEVVLKNDIEVSIEPISDPTDFITSIYSAYAVRLFEVTISRQNPFDADEFFQKHWEVYVDATNAEKGKVTVLGSQLDTGTLADVTKAIAATGNDAKALLKGAQGERFHTKRLRDNPAQFAVEEEEISVGESLNKARSLYKQVRGGQDAVQDDSN